MEFETINISDNFDPYQGDSSLMGADMLMNNSSKSVSYGVTSADLEPPSLDYFDNGTSFGGQNDHSLGQSTANTDSNFFGTNDTSYNRFQSNIPDIPQSAPSNYNEPKLDLLKKKQECLQKLRRYEKRGYTTSKQYTMDSPYEEMLAEKDAIKSIRAREQGIEFQSQFLIGTCQIIEQTNKKFKEPLGIHLDGFSAMVEDTVDNYDDQFDDMYDFFQENLPSNPLLQIAVGVSYNAYTCHLMNSQAKSQQPGVDDMIRNDPILQRQVHEAQLRSQKFQAQTVANYGSFVTGVDQTLANNGPPPPPIDTRPVAKSTQPSDYHHQEQPKPNIMNTSFVDTRVMPGASGRSMRPEMKGPVDLDNILGDLSSGLKTRTINIQQPANDNNSSRISFSDIGEMHSGDAALPKRSKRKQKSDRNSVQIDL